MYYNINLIQTLLIIFFIILIAIFIFQVANDKKYTSIIYCIY